MTPTELANDQPVRFTTQGTKAIGESHKRYQKYEQGVKAAGGQVIGSYGMLGEYDLITIAELPDEKTAARLSVATMSGGMVSIRSRGSAPSSAGNG